MLQQQRYLVGIDGWRYKVESTLCWAVSPFLRICRWHTPPAYLSRELFEVKTRQLATINLNMIFALYWTRSLLKLVLLIYKKYKKYLFTEIKKNKKLSWRRGTARRAVSWDLVNYCTCVRKIPSEKASNRWMTLKVTRGYRSEDEKREWSKGQLRQVRQVIIMMRMMSWCYYLSTASRHVTTTRRSTVYLHWCRSSSLPNTDKHRMAQKQATVSQQGVRNFAKMLSD